MDNLCREISKNEIEVNSVFNEVTDYLLQVNGRLQLIHITLLIERLSFVMIEDSRRYIFLLH